MLWLWSSNPFECLTQVLPEPHMYQVKSIRVPEAYLSAHLPFAETETRIPLEALR